MATDPEDSERPGLAVLPTSLAGRFVKYVVGFGIAVGIGLAPFLGKIAGVDALLNLFPLTLRGGLIPVSAFLMGLVAVAIQYYSRETLNPKALRKRFGVTWLTLLAALLLLFIFYSLFVVPVYSQDAKKTIPIIIADHRIQGPGCGCPAESTTRGCINYLSFDPAAIETCWDASSIQLRGLVLSLNYLLVTGGFGGLIGLLLLQEEAKKKQRRPPKAAAASKAPDSSPPHGTS